MQEPYLDAARESQPPAWRHWAGRLGALFLGGVLLVAAWTKAIDPAAFVEQIGNLGLDRLLPAWPLAMVALALEVGLGLALVLNVRRPLVLVPATLLVGFFVALTGWEWWRFAHGLLDPAAGCGCFGNLVQRTPKQAFFQDVGLLVPPLALAWLASGRRTAGQGWRLVTAVVVALGAAVFAARAPELPLDDLATRLRPGTEVASLCAGAADGEERICLTDVVPELAQGRHWVILSGLETPGLAASIDDLNRRALASASPGLWLVSPATTSELQAFLWDFGPAFEVRQAEGALLRPLYRRLPRSFEVRDGRVTATFDGMPPVLGGTTRG